jgi:Na+/melibiose symporter-like transporter
MIMKIKNAILFVCGQIGIMMLARYFFQWILAFCSEKPLDASELTLMSVSTVGALLLGFRLFDGVTDPIAGSLADRWVKSGKERRTLLWYTALFPAIGLVLCFTPNTEMSTTWRWLLLSAGMFVFFVGYTIYAIPYWSLVGDYTQHDESSRDLLSTLLGVGILIATAIGFIITPLLIKNYGYLDSAIYLAVLSIPLMIAPYFAAPQNIRSSATNRDSESSETLASQANHNGEEAVSKQSQWKVFKRALNHPRFRATLCLFAGSQMSFTVMTAAAPFIAVDLLGGTKADVSLLLGPLLGLALPASIFLPWFTRKVGWEKGIMWSCLGLGLVYLGVGCVGVNIIGSPLTTACILFALGGPMVAALLGLEGSAVTACADDEDGEAVGIYFGVYNLVVKAFNGVAIAMTAFFVEMAYQGSTPNLWAIRMMAMSAGGLLLLGLIAYVILRPRTQV